MREEFTPNAILVSDHIEERYARQLELAAPRQSRVVLRPGGAQGDSTAVEVAFFSGDLYPERVREFALALRESKRLRWLHTFSAGVDHPWFRDLLKRGVRISTSSGAMAVPIAHTVMLYILAFARDLRGWLDAQARREWRPRDIRDVQGRCLGVLGLGPIGLEVARLGAAFGMNAIGLRRKPRGDEPCETWSFDRLDELLARADYLVLALPLTEQTRHLLDARALGRMKSEAVLVNVGRGALVDESALARALAERSLAGAALDVFEVEPLPPESPLWTLPNLIVTPHSSGTNPGHRARAAEMFLDNLDRYTRGDALSNEVP